MQINIYEAKTRLSELVEQARQGQTVVIAKNGTPLAKLVPLDHPPKRKIIYGLMKGEFIEADDFDAPLPDDLLAMFEGRDPTPPAAEATGVVPPVLPLTPYPAPSATAAPVGVVAEPTPPAYPARKPAATRGKRR